MQGGGSAGISTAITITSASAEAVDISEYSREQKQNGFLFACTVALAVAVAETWPTHCVARFFGWRRWDRFSAVGFQAYFTGPVSGVIACSLLMPTLAAPTLLGFYTLVPVMVVINYTLAFGVAKLVAIANNFFGTAHRKLWCCSIGADCS